MRLKFNDVEMEDSFVDYVDYLSKGLPPKKSEAEECLRAFAKEAVANSISDDEDDANYGCVVVEADILEEAFRRVYENNVANTKKWIGISIGAGVAGLLVGALFINTGKQSSTKQQNKEGS